MTPTEPTAPPVAGQPIAPPPPQTPPQPIRRARRGQAPSDAVTFQILDAKGEAYRATPLHRHYEPDLQAAFYLRPLTGADMENASRLAGDKVEQVPMYMIFFGVQHPSIGPLEYAALNKNSPGIKGRLLQAIREISGMGDDVLDKAKLDLLAKDTDDSSGTDSPENSDTDQ